MFSGAFPTSIRKMMPWRAFRKIMRKIRPSTHPATSPGRSGFHSSEDGQEVWIETPQPPHNLVNILYNDVYETMIDHHASGLGRHMTPLGFANNVVEKQRILYVRDDATGRYFSVGWLPVCRPYEQFRCRAGFGYQIIENTTLGLEVTWRIYVPHDPDPVEVWDVSLKDVGGRPRRLSLFSYVAMNCDGVNLLCGELYRTARYDPKLAAILVRMDAERHREIDFPWHNGFMTANRAPSGWDASPGQFIGQDGRTLANPLAVEQGRCTDSMCAMWAPCAALRWTLELPPGGMEQLRILAGACDGEAMVGRLRTMYLGKSAAQDRHFTLLRERQAKFLSAVQIDTPEPTINRMLNAWVKIQSHYGLVWGAWGAFGYRDVLQQAVSNLTQDAGLSRAKIIEALRHQQADGFALRGWRPLGIKRSSDSAQWLVYAVTEYLKETGEMKFLEQRIPYLDRGEASVYDHLMQALRRLRTDRGRHGLCLIFEGDWNDSLTAVGRQNRGESVWLSMAFCRAANRMAELAGRFGRPADAQLLAGWRAEMREAINRHGWDGNWYLCALDDAGLAIGSAGESEGRIFLNTQSWAQLGGVASDERWDKAWVSVRRHLDTGWGLTLHWPAYTRPQFNIGRVTYIRPGAAENASVYTHGNAFMFQALLERGLADEALDVWQAINPANPNRPGQCMPNIFYNAYYGPDSEVMPGLADHPWVTGSAAWMYDGVLELMLGLRRGYDGITIQPCLPGCWPSARVTRVFRGTTYHVIIENPARISGAQVESMSVDGEYHPPEQPLPLDGSRHTVVVTLGGEVKPRRGRQKVEYRHGALEDQDFSSDAFQLKSAGTNVG